MTEERAIKIAPLNVPCGFSYCETGKNAIHILTDDFPYSSAGTPLCGYHSPYSVTPADIDAQNTVSEMNRWEVILTPVDRKNERVIHTFTWAPVRSQAYTRIADMFENDRETWAGWNFTVALYPTHIIGKA